MTDMIITHALALAIGVNLGVLLGAFCRGLERSEDTGHD